MTIASISPQSSNEHTTIVTLNDATGESYCALTRHEQDQPQWTITRRIGAHEPSFVEAMRYVRVKFFPGAGSNSIGCVDHEFELLANREVLHRFAVVEVTANGDTTRENVDLTTHEAWSGRVQLAVRLLLKLGA
jgi:hypothetical protein